MNGRRWLLVLVFSLVVAGCGRLGTGLPSCRVTSAGPNAATILSLQAVPEAAYSPCLEKLNPGWEQVGFSVESGEVVLEFERDLEESFLQVRLNPSCELGDAEEVPSDIEGVSRFEDVVAVSDRIKVTIVPDGYRPLIHAVDLKEELEGMKIEDRRLVFTIAEDLSVPVGTRVDAAFVTDEFVWIIGDIDREEGTLEMRAARDAEPAHGLDVDEALERIEDLIEEAQYTGQWYLVFDGGCITYDFDVDGSLVPTIVDDAEAAIGLYPNDQLRDVIGLSGFDIADE